jgi:NADP-dependent 3-hydroxy acid dehydrogenase YdfG
MNKQNIQDLFDVTGKVALITGATGGFGKAAASALAAAGARVVITGRTPTKLEECAKETGAAKYFAGEPANEEDVAKVVKATVDGF